MSGDVQPRKRKDKKRKKDDEDAVKETPSARQPSAGAAQAATQPGDIQMHIHSEHGTGGNWCAKIVFFLLLTCLGVLTGLIMIENRGVSNADTPLSESRYAEYFSGWVDENREDDHHHEDILNALNQLEEEHGDDDGHDEEPYTEEEDHDDDEQGGHDEEDEADEEELRKLDDDEVEEIVAAEKKVAQQEAALARDDDDADDNGNDADDDEEGDEPNQANNIDDDDDDDDNDEEEEADDDDEEIDQGENDDQNVFEEDNNDDDDEDDDEEEESDAPKIVDNQPTDDDPNDDNDNDATDSPAGEEGEKDDVDDDDDDADGANVDQDNDDDADDDDDAAEDAPAAVPQTTTGKVDDGDDDDVDDGKEDDDDDGAVVKDESNDEADAIAKEIENIADANDADDDGDNDEDDDDEDDNSPFDEEANKLNLASTENEVPKGAEATGSSNKDSTVVVDQLEKPDISVEILKSQMDDLVENYNKLAEMLNVPKEDYFQDTISIKDENDDDQIDQQVDDDGDDDNDLGGKVEERTSFAPNDDDGDDDVDGDDDGDGDAFENFVDNDGGEEEYLAKVRQEQELKNQRLQQQEKEEPREESSLTVQIFVGVALIVAAHLVLKPPGAPARTDPSAAKSKQSMPQAASTGMPSVAKLEEKVQNSAATVRAAEERSARMEEFVNEAINLANQSMFGDEDGKIIVGGAMVDKELEGELYSGDEDFEYDQEEYIDELEEIEEEEEEDVEIEYAANVEEKRLEEAEREIGTFVPTTFEEFSAMYRPNTTQPEIEEPVPEPTPEPSIPSAVPSSSSSTKSPEPSIFKNSPLMKKKPPKGAVNKLIYGLHKEPLLSADDFKSSAEAKEIPSRPSESDSYQGELERAKRQLDEFKDTKAALQSFETLLGRYPDLKPALVGKARTLDLMAEQQQSNTILEDAIEAYRKVLALGRSLDDGTLQTIAERCINRIRFSGQYLKAVDVHQVLIKRFDSEPKFRNQLAVTYLMANRLAEAKAVLHETLLRWIEDGFALVHYGFVVKNHDKNMEEAVQYLQEGIATGHEGTQDGRFYFHLGDALQRLGRNEEALKVYQKGADKKLFLSMYQRSLYNEDNLKSHPFWTVEQTTYGGQLELIRSQWTTIRDEGLRLLNSAGNFKDEAENLRDTGDWKQFELFMRGHRIEKNCAKAPLTCKLVEQFTAARTCKRGQVKFSVMHPGTHVWPHCGPTNCRIRAHLGLKVPSDTYIRVAEETRSWQDGQWLIFDDSYEHEVWHNGTGTRLVLIVDFWHPDLSESQRRTLSPI